MAPGEGRGGGIWAQERGCCLRQCVWGNIIRVVVLSGVGFVVDRVFIGVCDAFFVAFTL